MVKARECEKDGAWWRSVLLSVTTSAGLSSKKSAAMPKSANDKRCAEVGSFCVSRTVHIRGIASYVAEVLVEFWPAPV